MGGLNQFDKLREQGVDAKKDTLGKVDVADIYIPRTGPLAHPRAADPIDLELLADVMRVGEVVEPIDVRRDGMYESKMRLTLIDGSRRTLTLLEAVRRWKAAGTFREEQKYVRVRFFVGDDKAALLHRLRKNSDPLKKPDAPSVLARTVLQLRAAKASDDEILAVMPRCVQTRADLVALERWDDLTAEAAARADQGDVPLAVVAAALLAPREGQLELIERRLAAGVRTAAAATRARNREAGKAPGPQPLGRKKLARIEAAMATRTDTWTVDEPGFGLALQLVLGKISVAELPAELRKVVEDALAKPKRAKVATP